MQKRNLDGVYFRVEREGKWDNICFSDMTKEERNKLMENRDNEWLKSMCQILADTIANIGEQFDIICE